MLTTANYEFRNNEPKPQTAMAQRLQRIVQNEGFYEKNQLTITSTSSKTSSTLLKILREIQLKKDLREESQRRRSTANESMFEFLNQKSRLYEYKFKVYNFFHKPEHLFAYIYHILVFCLVLTCLIVTVFASMSRFVDKASQVLLILEKIIIVWFANEFCLRLWSSSCKKRYEGWKGKVAYLRMPSHALDLLVVIMSAVVLIAETRKGSAVFAVSAFRGFHRLFQVFQMLALRHKVQPWKLLWAVVTDQLHQLLIIIYIEFASVFILAYISYLLEKDAPNTQLTNMAEAMWWAVITLSTVGYGDRVHVTWWGKLVSSMFTVLGVALFALPAGIIGAGLAIRIEKEESTRKKKKKKLAAALLIQSTWKCYKTLSRMESEARIGDLYIINDSMEKIVLKFVGLTKFFVAKSKFKAANVLDLESAWVDHRFKRTEINSSVKRVKGIVETIDKTIGDNQCQSGDNRRRLLARINNICSIIECIESQVNRQNNLIDFVSFNSVVTESQLKYFTEFRDKNKSIQRHNSLSDSENDLEMRQSMP